VPNLKARLRATGFDRVNVLHIRDARFGFLLDLIECDYSVFRLADNDSGFAHFSRAYHAELDHIAKRVTHFYYTAQSLEPTVSRLAPVRTTCIENGVSMARFERPCLDRPIDLQGVPDPIALYVGSIDRWFDFELVRYAAVQLPSISFVLIGPSRLVPDDIARLGNVHVLGRRAHDVIPAYLQHASVGLIPFDVHGHAALVDAINPIKLYEYLAAGLPTVSVSWEELRRINPPAALTKTPDEFVAAIARSIEQPPDRQELQRFARQFDWSMVYARLRRFIGA
jgi:glycosyltransferase involved in cell wall biosynthesis